MDYKDCKEIERKAKELDQKAENLDRESESVFCAVDGIVKENVRVADIAANSEIILNNLDAEFEQATTLNSTDVRFLLFATMLQSLRWVLMPCLNLPNMENLDPMVAKEHRLKPNERSHKGGIYDGKSSGAEYELQKLKDYREKHLEQAQQSKNAFYKRKEQYRGWIEILTQPVPYDAMNAADNKSIPNIANLNLQDRHGNYNNIYAKNHHVATLGHDPILGWIFGTANIMSSTISFVDFQHFDVRRGHRVKSLGRFIENRELQFSDQVVDDRAPRNFYSILNECYQSAKEDYKRIAAAVVRQAIHVASDKYCIEGLPIPILSTINPQKAQELIESGWNSVEFEKLLKKDLRSVTISAILSALINIIIEAIYLFCIESSDDLEIKKVRIKKVLSIAGTISSTSNVLRKTLTKDFSKLDIGGIGVTIITLLNSVDFTQKIKQEYINRNFETLIMLGNRN